MSVLARIMERKRQEVAQRRQACPLAELEEAARAASPPRGFRAALAAAAQEGYGLIAEIKKASPSQGVIRSDFDPPALARACAGGGATCLSVLTDTSDFQGADTDLAAARNEVALPVLRKDFLFDPYQIAESRALGADCVLLILAALDPGQTGELMAAAAEWRMDVLVETHDGQEFDRALEAGAGLIGINNRNLATFETDLAVTERWAPKAPPGPVLVSESGLAGPADLARLARVGVRCFLVGESLMRAADVTAAVRALLPPAAAAA